MKSWRMDPILGEPIKRKESEEYSDFSLQVERAALRSNGAIQVTYQLWNEQPHLTRSCAPSIKKELAEACQDILGVAPDLDPVDLSRVLAKLEVDAGQQEPRSRADASDEAPREQLSLSPPGFVCVALDDEGRRVYVVRSEEGGLDVVPSVVGRYLGEEVTHVPPPDLPWPLPRASAIVEHYACAGDVGWAAGLMADLEAWHQAASDLGRDEAYVLLSVYVMSTYVPELCDYYAELLLEADAERGKTRTGQAAIFASRHGHHVIGIREASLLRDADHRQSALFIDLKDLWGAAQRNNCEDVLLGRFEKGAQVERVLHPDAGPHADTTFFKVFGPTILATNKRIDDILETRALGIDMPLSARRFSGRIEPQDALPLVERLMAWRALMLIRGALPDVEPPTDGRLGDILRPLKHVLLAVNASRMAEFDQVVTWQTGRRRDDLSQSYAGAVVKAVLSFAAARKDGDHVPTKDVLDAVNAGRDENQQVSAPSLGRKLRTLGWTVERVGHDNMRCLRWDADLLKRLCARYGVSDEAQTQASGDDAENRSQRSHGSQQAQYVGAPAANRSHAELNRSQPAENRSHAPGAPAREGATAATAATGFTDTDVESF